MLLDVTITGFVSKAEHIIQILTLLTLFGLINGKSNSEQVFNKRLHNDDDDDDDLCINKEISISRTLNLGKNKSAWIFDNSLPSCLTKEWLESLLYNDNNNGYKFNRQATTNNRSVISNHTGALWSKTVSLEELEKKVSGWNKLFQVVENLTNKKVKVIESHIDLYQSMDPLSPFIPSDCSTDYYYLTIFINDMWNLNDYAQFLFYDVDEQSDQKGKWEIIETVHPHAYRAILWPSCQLVLLKPPCINRFNYFKTINLKLSTNIDDPGGSKSSNQLNEENISHFRLDRNQEEKNFSKHLFKSFNDGDLRRRISVFDGLFTTDELTKFRSVLLQVDPYHYDFDTQPTEDHDNILRVGLYQVKDFVRSDMWIRLRALCKFVSNHSGWFPYDVTLNHVRFSDHNRIHPDAKPYQDELTMVLYLNDDLTATDYGETTFYVSRPDDGVHKFTGDGGTLYEAIGSVAPKFGRITVFTNNIEHSAHPPSIKYPGCRYTFAVKVAKSRRLALIKMVYEGMDVLPMNKQMMKLRSDLESGVLDAEESYPTSSLEKLLQRISKLKVV